LNHSKAVGLWITGGFAFDPHHRFGASRGDHRTITTEGAQWSDQKRIRFVAAYSSGDFATMELIAAKKPATTRQRGHEVIE
jgi:hypothetical protein